MLLSIWMVDKIKFHLVESSSSVLDDVHRCLHLHVPQVFASPTIINIGLQYTSKCIFIPYVNSSLQINCFKRKRAAKKCVH